MGPKKSEHSVFVHLSVSTSKMQPWDVITSGMFCVSQQKEMCHVAYGLWLDVHTLTHLLIS